MLVPQMDDTEATGGLENFIEGRRHNVGEVREALERMRDGRRKRDSTTTRRFSGRQPAPASRRATSS